MKRKNWNNPLQEEKKKKVRLTQKHPLLHF